MAGSTITQRIALEGAEQIKQALSQIGKVGEEAFAQIQAAGENVKLEKPFGAVDAAAARAGTSIDTMRVRVSNASGAFGAARSAAQGLGDQVGNAASAMSGAQRAGAALANVVLATGSAMRGVGSAVAAGTAQFTNLNFGVTSVAGAFRNAVGEVLKTTGALAALPATLFALAKSASEHRQRNSQQCSGRRRLDHRLSGIRGSSGQTRRRTGAARPGVCGHRVPSERSATRSDRCRQSQRQVCSFGLHSARGDEPALPRSARAGLGCRWRLRTVRNCSHAIRRQSARSHRDLQGGRRSDSRHPGSCRSGGTRRRTVRATGWTGSRPLPVEGRGGNRADRQAAAKSGPDPDARPRSASASR